MYILIICIAISVISISAQVRPSRTWHTDVARATGIDGVMPSLLGGGEIQRSAGSLGGEQAWQFRTHVQVEPYRFTDSTRAIQLTTSIEAHQELTANPLNDISFNPRAMRWEEFFWFHVGLPDVSLRAGFVHRCKHDIDNLGGADEGNPTSPLLAEQRTIILTGPTAAATLAPVVSAAGTTSVAAGVEFYLNASDSRTPRSTSASWSEMQGTSWMRMRHAYPVSRILDLSATAYVALPWFSSRTGSDGTLPYEARAELAVAARGTKACMELALVAERQFDEIAFTTPQQTSFVGLCVRFMP
ncbi:MAG: hypothetical protein ACK5BQ_10915 [Ignavibacteria bacterium]|jgi:hypothetical protein